MTSNRLPRCILITPARNEAALIEKTIQSVATQTAPPIRWVIVNDGSTDDTGVIARRHAGRHGWIDVIDMPSHRDRSFAAKAHCFAAGYNRVKALDHEVVGNLDADLSFENDYLEFLLRKFVDDPDLGVTGTIFKEADGYSSDTDSFEGLNHVAGGCQLFRRRCFEDVGGYVPNRVGGIDWIAVTKARMMGWKTRSYREKWFFHHRSLGTAQRGKLAAGFVYGQKDYLFGGHPLYELFRVAYRMTKRPYVLDGLAIGAGYAWAGLRRIDRPVSDELMRFHRREQLRKLRLIVKSLLAFRRVDSFLLMANQVESPRRLRHP
jgi:glycosyltransferase involved in cell wall biosynthesis